MPGLHWTDDEVLSLEAQLKAGSFLEDVKIPGKTDAAIRSKATRLGLTGDGIPREIWTEEDKNALKDYVAAGWSATDIVEAVSLGVPVFPSRKKRNRNSIQKQIQRMGIANKRLSRIQKSVRQFTQEEKQEFRAFLRENYLSMTPEEMAKEWILKHPDWKQTGAVSRMTKRIRAHLTLLGLKLPREVIIRMPYSRKKFRNRRKKKKAKG
jgi:hypothetical protein